MSPVTPEHSPAKAGSLLGNPEQGPPLGLELEISSYLVNFNTPAAQTHGGKQRMCCERVHFIPLSPGKHKACP